MSPYLCDYSLMAGLPFRPSELPFDLPLLLLQVFHITPLLSRSGTVLCLLLKIGVVGFLSFRPSLPEFFSFRLFTEHFILCRKKSKRNQQYKNEEVFFISDHLKLNQ
jgi:hypothetical protein